MARLVFAVGAGACLVLALPLYSILPLAILSFGCLAVILRDATAGSGLLIGFMFGLGQFVPGLFWISESFQVDAERFGWLALPAALGLAAGLSLFPALACLLAARLVRSGWPPALSVATSWTLAEWLRGHVLTGSPERERIGPDTIYRNAVLAIGPDGTALARYAKHHLVPFGEYVPWRSMLPFRRIVESRGDFAAGPEPRTLAFGPLPFPGVAICHEIIFPGHVVDDAIRPDWISNATNDAWFGTSIGPRQHLAAARMRAVEEGLPLVRAANTGISAVVDPFGRVRALLDLGQQGIIDADLPRPLGATPYARFGDWMLLALLFGTWAVSRAACWRIARFQPLKQQTGNAP